MNRTALIAVCVCMAGALVSGCKMPTLKSTDVMYGPGGEIVEMKSPREEMKIKVKEDGTVKVKGARGIGGRPRMAPLPVESERDVSVHDVPVPPPAGHVAPIAPAPGVPVESQSVTEETTVVR
jgi:flagellar basal body rod protein FlgF